MNKILIQYTFKDYTLPFDSTTKLTFVVAENFESAKTKLKEHYKAKNIASLIQYGEEYYAISDIKEVETIM